ncbi:hypothetical protein [Marinobacter sp. LV10R520-4]|nr:hypothetical protein [Marinobacter sp. LV10R520-4]
MNFVIKEGVSLQGAAAKVTKISKQMKEKFIDQAALDAAAAKGR